MSRNGDKKPQTLTIRWSTDAANVWKATLAEIPLLGIMQGTTRVIEVLKVRSEMLVGPFTERMAISMGSASYGGQSSLSPGLGGLDNVGLDRRNFYFDLFQWNAMGEGSRTTDFSDANGNGMLYPAQAFIVNAAQTSGAVLASVGAMYITYRIKTASLEEYIGIINQFTVTTQL